MTQRPKFMMVADLILERIKSGEYPEGSRLPEFRTFMEVGECSLSTVHEAVRHLRTQGYISYDAKRKVGGTTRRGRAVYISHPRPDSEESVAHRIAEKIRKDLICCDIYARIAQGHTTIKQARVVREWHEMCYWGEVAARIAEGGNEDRDDA